MGYMDLDLSHVTPIHSNRTRLSARNHAAQIPRPGSRDSNSVDGFRP